ncbi:MAG: hypothetical protein R2751_15060 [Bacteroidales bacterium]
MEETHHIDELDRKILALITKNARIPTWKWPGNAKYPGLRFTSGYSV